MRGLYFKRRDTEAMGRDREYRRGMEECMREEEAEGIDVEQHKIKILFGICDWVLPPS